MPGIEMNSSVKDEHSAQQDVVNAGGQVIFDKPCHPTLIEASRPIALVTSEAPNEFPGQQNLTAFEQSFAQERLWFVDQLYPGLSWYTVPFALRLKGPLQLDALEAALQALERRHETLRTTFGTVNGVNVQTVRPFRPRELNVIHIEPSDQDRLLDLLQQDRKAFKLDAEPGWRVSVYRMDSHHHVLSIVLHHIISDGWSVDVLRRDLAVFYSAALQGRDPFPELDPLPVQYREYSAWQKQKAQTDKHQQQLDYWVKQLESSRPAELLCDKIRPATLSGQAGLQRFGVEGSCHDDLHRFCKDRGLNPHAVLLAAFRATHYRLTGAGDATLGVADVNRDRRELRDVVGPFVNIQCIRISVGDESFESLISQTQATLAASLSKRDVPLEKVISALQVDTDPSRHPLVQITFFFHSQSDIQDSLLESIEHEVIESPITSRFDIEFHIYQTERSLRGEVVFSTSLYNPETISNMVSVFQNVLEQGLAEPACAISSLPLLTPKCYSMLEELDLIQIQRTEYPRNLSVVDVFRQQAITSPDRVAVKDALTQRTYAQLDKESDIIAHWLAGQLFAAETVVGVFAGRSCQTIIAFLGILKANLAYLPFDINTPINRMKAILSSIQGRKLVLVGSKEVAPAFQQDPVEFVHIAAILEMQARCNQQVATLTAPSATSLAYVMFTSGSTGQPKGVMVEHRGIVRAAKKNNFVEYLPDVVIMGHITNVAFDNSTWEIYATLLNGGTLICIDSMVVLNPGALGKAFLQERINCALFTPALLKEYLIGCPTAVAALHSVYVGGDRADPQDMFTTHKLTGGKVINGCGPTENTVTSAIYCLPEQEMCVNGVPIGRAISNSGAYVMDPQQRLVPLGVVGELVVTGDGLARGYIDPQQDSGRFITVIIGDEQVRAYRTGDCVRQRPVDGQLEFLGRLDGQVKIQGYRVEPGEVDHIIRSQEDVKDAITVLQEGEGQEARLISFITINNHGTTTVGSPDRGCEKEHVEVWKMRLDNETYSPINRIQLEAVGRDFIGWTSMYDGSEIDKDEMNEWLDDTIEAILDGKSPGHVLEVGTGSGMILFNLTEGLQSYTGLDLSERAVNFVVETARSIPTLTDKVTMYKAAAASVSQLQPHTEPNLVVLNSVVQYFPSQEYLVNVIRDLLQLRGVETLFFGDIRSYALYKEFLASRALYIAGERASGSEIQRIMHNMEQAESELLVDPAFFTALLDIFPDYIEHVEILPKKMQATNELSCYRYAAVIYTKKGQEGPQRRQIYSIPPDGWIDYMDRGLDRQSLTQLLQRSSASPAIAISNIPHDKTIFERHVVDTLASQGRNDSDQNNWLSAARQQAINVPSLSANDLVMLAKQANYQVEISWARQHTQRGGFDAVFHLQARDGGARTLFRFPTDHQGRPGWSFTSRPLQQKVWQAVQEQLHETLRAQLPSYMVPQRIVILDSLPLNANGKVDRQTLARDAKAQDVRRGPLRQPTLRSEREMQKIWAKVLNIDPETIGIDDNFFHLGGSSIAAMKVVGEASRAGMKLTVADIFRQPMLRLLVGQLLAQDSSISDSISSLKQSNTLKQSFAQERLWFVDQLYPGLSWYTVPFALRLKGPLQLDALEAALQALERRHETLRTTFGTVNGVNVQTVRPFRPRELNVIHIEPSDQDRLLDLLQQDRKAFKLDAEPGWRVSVYRMDSHHHVLSIVLHHIISDGWSVDVLRRDLAVFYSAALQGRDPFPELDPLPVQYREYSAWQKQKAQTDKHQQQLDYWVKQLESSRPAELLCDKIRPATLSGQAGLQELRIEGALYTKLQSFCQVYGVTPFVVLLTAFRATQYRLTGVDDVSIGVPNANRDRWELENMVGFFVNMQCIRTTIQEESFEQLARQVQERSIASFENQDVPFEQIVAQLCTSRDLARHPLVQIVFALHSQLNLGDFTLEGLDLEAIASPTNSRFDLEFHFYQEDKAFRGEALFSTDLYHPGTISNMLSIFQVVLEKGLKDPTTPIATMPLFTDSSYSSLERMGLVRTQTTTYPRESSIVDAFQQQVINHPDRLAVKDSSCQMTYSQLDLKSDLLARWLVKRQFAAGALIGVLADRSCYTVIAFLGILKANVAYLPLDPKTPASRLGAIFSSIRGQSQNLILLGARMESIVADLKDFELRSILDIVSRSSKADNECKDLDLEPLPSPTSLAYVMFTSGTTGRPKGVMVEHRNVVRLVKGSNMIQYIPPATSIAHISSIAFDASTWEIYASLLNGGTLVCLDPMVILDYAALPEIFNREQIRSLFITPALLRQYIIQCPAILYQLDALYVGGDRLDPSDIKSAQRLVRGSIINGYGPTENTSFSTMYCFSETEMCVNGVPIGRAISNSGAYVMDPQQRLVPLGVVGELVVTGDGLARGYIDPQQDSGRFVTVLIGGEQVRAYRTGDYVRYRPHDAQLEFFGRLDGQVKIRGQRVELEEVDYVLRGQKLVKEVATVWQQLESQESYLISFVTIHESQTVTDDEILGRDSRVLDDWESRFDVETYASFSSIELAAVGRDFIGWTSMYDGSEIDKDEMNEWLDDTIEAILDGKSPGHVLEVGTGSGMILFNLTEGLQSYTGLDLSERAVNFVVETARSIPTLTDKVTMYKAAAASVSQLQPHTEPNLVVLNSVVQYFPSQEYLVNVIRDLLQLRGVETLFFGDIRSYALYKEFLASRALYIAGERASGSEIQRIMHNMEQAESELLVDPAFFTALLDIFPDYIEHVEILPKKMQATNELSCYRYAAVIYTKKGQEGPQRRQIYSIPPDGWIDYMDRGLDRQSLTQLLQRSSASPAIAISNIPHDKTIFERHVVDTLASQGRNDSDQNNWLSAARQQAINVPSLSANDLVMLAKQANYQVEISWARQHTQRGGFDAVFHRQARDGGARTLFRFPTDHQGRPGWSFTSRPLQQKVWQAVQEQLHETLRAQLPSYMVPQRIVILDSLPLNANGKVDRQTLARDAKAQDVRRGPLRQPTLRSEREMQKIWAKVLNIDPETIGIDDNFFHLGGSSIAAMKVVGEASRAGMKLTVADIFRQPTLHHIAVLSLHQTNNTCQNIEPFSLISDRTRSSSFLNYITTNYHLNATSVQDAYPCTPLQEGLLSLTSMRPGGYIAQEVFSLSHCADVVALCKAFESVSHAMPILRTRFVQHDAVGLVQVVLDEDIHWNHAVGLDTYLEADLRELMVLGQPYIRYALVKDESGEFTWLVWTIHHALYDGWSMRIIKDAVSRCYYGHAIDQGPPFSTFIRYIGDQKPDNQSRYWLDALSNCECTQFPSLPSWIEYPVVDEVIDTTLASVPQRTGNITTSNLVRAAWAVVVSRITNSTDVVFGATISGRNAPVAGIDAMAAPTFATVPLRLKVSDSQKVLEYLAAVQEQAIEMIPYEQTGLHRIAKLSADTKKACMFQTLLVVQPQDIENTRQVLHEVQRTGQQQRFNNYALVLELHLGSDSLTARASFDPRILEAWMVHKLLTSLEVVMHQLDSAGVETTLSSIDMVTTKDLDQIWSWNGSNTIPVNKCVHDMIVDLAQAQPTAPAICSWDGELTYHELDQLSSSLASELIRLGIRPDTFVPLCFEKSMWAAVAMMSVLKAGGAFVHLDMSQASDRRERILAQLNANVVLASRNHAQTLAAFGRVVIPIDAAGLKDLLPISRAAQILRVEPLSAAYAIFTSGSTGQPKGVVVEHRSMSTSCFWLGREMGVNEHSRVLQFSSYSFDGCIMDIFTTLLYGGCVCIPNDDERLGNLEQGINRLRANHIFLTPSVARLLNPNLVPSLETIVIGGEIATDEDFKRWQHLPRVIHAYGPTECTIICCLHSKINIDEKGAACIGKAVGSVCWVVSPENHNRLAPLGSIGELVVEGPVLARGYLNDPEGTALVFIENPPWLLQGGPDHPGRQGRLYKTGDLVRYNKDGTLDFIGRKDTQVKISGQRVELGEVEHHVGLCIPAARQVVAEMVTLQGEGHEEGKSMLAAFLVMDETALERNPSDPSFPRLVDVPRAVEDALGESLPAHMKPAIYLAISKVPISSSGKTNRRELRDIGAAFSAKELSKWRNRAHADKRRPPSTEMERMLQQVWARVLKISPADIGVDESFLSLGGDSITAMRVSMVARSSGIDISAVDILRKKTISRLAASVSIRDIRPSSRAAGILEKSRRSSQPGPTDHHQLSSFPSALGEDFTRHGTSLLAQLGIATTDEIENIYPCTPFQRNIHAAQSKDPSLYRVILELEIAAGTDTGGVDLRRIERAWRSVVRRHSLLRTHLVDVTMGTGRMMNVVLRDPAPRITFETDSAGNGQQEFGQTRIGYSKDGLQHSLSIHQTATDRAHLRLEISHAIIDGYSTDILLRDFRIAYGGTLAENGPPFGEFVEYVEQQLQEADCDFWTKYLSDVPVCFFPTCMSHRTRAGTFRVTVPSINTHKLQAFCVEHEFTTASVIQVAWALVLHRYTGSMTPCFGILAASRDAPVSGVGDMFGPLLHLIPYRVALDSRRSVLETLKEVQGDCIDSLSHQVHPLTACQKSRCIGISRLFNTALSFIKTEKEPINQETTHIIRYIGYQDPVEYDVYIRALDRPGDLDIVLEFWNESISLIKGTEVAACLSMVLSAIISQDEQTIHRLISHMEVDCTGS